LELGLVFRMQKALAQPLEFRYRVAQDSLHGWVAIEVIALGIDHPEPLGRHLDKRAKVHSGRADAFLWRLPISNAFFHTSLYLRLVALAGLRVAQTLR
jgi:hypothetical protein